MNFFFKLMFFAILLPEGFQLSLEEENIVQFGVDDVLRLVVQDNEYQFLNSYTVWFFHINGKSDVFDVVPRDDGFTSEGILSLIRSSFNIWKRQMAWRDDNTVVPVF